jgi:hypothetical protein
MCHEYICADARLTEDVKIIDQVLVRHLPDNTKSRSNYLDLLQANIAEWPDCARSNFYLGREYSYRQQWHLVIPRLERYVELSQTRPYQEELAYAQRLLARAYQHQGHAGAEHWYNCSIATNPQSRESRYYYADYLRSQQRWTECRGQAEACVAILDRSAGFTSENLVWGMAPWDLLALACYYSGDRPASLVAGIRALSYEPDNQRLKQNIKFYGETNHASA